MFGDTWLNATEQTELLEQAAGVTMLLCLQTELVHDDELVGLLPWTHSLHDLNEDFDRRPFLYFIQHIFSVPYIAIPIVVIIIVTLLYSFLF